MSDPPISSVDEDFMVQALQLAKQAASVGEVPIGALVVHEGNIIGAAHNRRELDQDPTAHAEVLALRQAATHRGTWRLENVTVYVTLEPCAMCAGAMVLSRIGRCVWGCPDPKGGFVGTLGNLSQYPGLNHRFEVTSGVMQQPCAEQLRGFFKALREQKRNAGVK